MRQRIERNNPNKKLCERFSGGCCLVLWHLKSDFHAQYRQWRPQIYVRFCDEGCTAVAVPHSNDSIQTVQLHSIQQSLQAIRSKHVDATSHAKVAAAAVSCVAIMTERFGTI